VPPRSPFVRRRRLGHELRALRDARALTAEQVGNVLDWSPSKISRIETTQVKVTAVDLRALLDVYEVEAERRAGLLELGRESRETGYWIRYQDQTPIATFADYIGFETEAVSLREYQSSLVPGLLQTKDYARAVLSAMRPDDPQIDDRVALRLERQKILTRELDPVYYSAVIDEAALRRPLGGMRRQEVMAEQLEKLLQVAALPRVTLQVLPFANGGHAALNGGFTILELPHGADPTVVYAESITFAQLMEEKDEVGFYIRTFESTRTEALGRDASIEIIRSVLRDSWPPARS
jgi:transcriptional regulator with XRE-family HTH domain